MAMEATEFAFPMDAEECEEGYDRVYTAADFARYFHAFITSGIIADGGNIAESLQVVTNDDMTTTLKAGNLIIDGYRYELTKDMVFQHRAADGVLDRIDRISITMDTAEREIHAILREGDFSYSPIAPQCRRTSEYIDYVVADVRIVNGSIKITQANITDTRLSTELCGIAFPFWKLDTGPFFVQLNSFYEEFVLKSDRSYEEFLAWAKEKKEEINSWQEKEEKENDAWQEEQSEEFTEWAEDFVNRMESWMLSRTENWQKEIMDWFDNLREKLSENVEVHLQEQIGNLNNLQTKEKGNLVNAINSLPLSYDETYMILCGVKTVNVTLRADDGANVDGQTVTLVNSDTGEEITKKYEEGGILFEVIGCTEYSLSVNEIEGYETPKPMTILISDGEGLVIDLEYKLKSLNDLPWAKIIEVSESGNASTIFSLHDEKEIELTTGEKIVVEIVGFDHDVLASDGSKTAGITFSMKDCLETTYRFNDDATNLQGWEMSSMRYFTIKEHFYDVLPEDLKAGIKTVKKGSTVGNISRVNATEDYVWLFSVVELGVDWDSYPYILEGTPYPAFTDDASRIKHKGEHGLSIRYYSRSAYVEDDRSFITIKDDGTVSIDNANVLCGLAVGFCV